MSDNDRESEKHSVEDEETEIGATSSFPPNNTTEVSITRETQHKERKRRRKPFVSRMKNALPLVLVIVFWVAVLVAVFMPGNDYNPILAGVILGIVGLLLVFLGLSVIKEKKITDSFSDDPHALEETYTGKDAVMLGWFYIFLGILFLCGSGYIFYLRLVD